MKTNKLLIYIALFFCLFMSGVTKVKATQYMICEYTVYSSNNDNFKQDIKLYGYFNEGRIIGWGVNKPTTTDSDLKYITPENGTKYWTTNDSGSASACPSVTVTKYDAKGMAGFKNIKSDGSKVEAVSSRYAYKNFTNKVCKYDAVGNTGYETVFYSEIGYVNTDILLKMIKDGFPGDGEYFFNRSTNFTSPEKANHFFSTVDNTGCPKYAEVHKVIKTSSTKPIIYRQYSNDQPINTANYSGNEFYQYVLNNTCDYKNNSTYSNLNKWINENYKNGKITTTLDNSFGTELLKKNKEWEDFVQTNNVMITSLSNETDEDKEKMFQNNICGFTDINEALMNMNNTCKENESCYGDDKEQFEDAGQKLSELGQSFKGLGFLGFGEYDSNLECEDIFGDKIDDGDKNDINNDGSPSLMYIINKIFTWIRIAVPILLIVLGISDFTKVVVSQDPDAMKKATSRFSKRCVMAIIIFFLPSIVMMILGWIDDYIMSTDPNCVIGSLNIILNNFLK